MKPHLRNQTGNELRKKIFGPAIPAALLLISACSVGPDYVRPALETPAACKENEPAKGSQSLDEVVSKNWWEIFADRELNTLEEQVEISNQNIAQAEARFRQARALVQAARAVYDTDVAAYRQSVRAAQQSLAVTTNQYQAGIVSYLNVVVAQTTALTNQRTAVDILGRRLTASVLLIKALGGGWKVS